MFEEKGRGGGGGGGGGSENFVISVALQTFIT